MNAKEEGVMVEGFSNAGTESVGKMLNNVPILCSGAEAGFSGQLYQGFFTAADGQLNPLLKKFFHRLIDDTFKKAQGSSFHGHVSQSRSFEEHVVDAHPVHDRSLNHHVRTAAQQFAVFKKRRMTTLGESDATQFQHHLQKSLHHSIEIESAVLAFLAMACVKPMISSNPVQDLNAQTEAAEASESMVQRHVVSVNPVRCAFWLSQSRKATTQAQEDPDDEGHVSAEEEPPTSKIKLCFELRSGDPDCSLLSQKFHFTTRTWSRRLTKLLEPLSAFLSRELEARVVLQVECAAYDPFVFHHGTPGFWKKAAHGFFLAHQLCSCVTSDWKKGPRVLDHNGVRVVSMELLDRKKQQPCFSSGSSDSNGSPLPRKEIDFAVNFAEIRSRGDAKIFVNPVYSVECRGRKFSVAVYAMTSSGGGEELHGTKRNTWGKNVVCSGLGLTQVESKVEQTVKLMRSHQLCDARTVCCAIRYLFNLTSCFVQ